MRKGISMHNTRRQTAGQGEIFLDHVGWFLPDLDCSLEIFTALGFVLTAKSVHGHQDPATGERHLVGSANRLAMLSLGYLEHLMPVEGTDTPVSRHMRRALDVRQGVHLVAFNVADAEAEAKAVTARGIGVMPTTHLRREVSTADGGTAEAAFTVIRAELGCLPEGRLQSVTHHTPEHVWQPRHVAVNGVSGLSEVIWSSPDPDASAARLSSYTGRPAEPVGDAMVIRLDRGHLTIANPEAVSASTGVFVAPSDQPCIAAIGFEGDPQRLAATAAAAGVPTRDHGDALVIPDIAGVALMVRAGCNEGKGNT
ncbi:MAG: VOC family protein [Paracoccaceae bacterium]